MINKKDKIIRKKYRNRYKIKKVNRSNLPRLSVFRADNNFYAQIIDDQKGHTIVACSTLQKEIKSKLDKTGNIQAAAVVGEKIAELAIEKGIKKIVFDRGACLYHGRVKASAEAARKKGLVF